jgi:hypothetical protein
MMGASPGDASLDRPAANQRERPMNRTEMPVSESKPTGLKRNRWRIIGWGAAALLLLTPYIAMHFTEEVNWNRMDFVVFGAMLAAVGVGFELAVRMTPNRAYRVAAAVALLAAFLLLWVNGAVGIIGNENNPANLMFIGVLAVAAVGALLSRGKPLGMARAMVAAAIAQLLVAVVAQLSGTGMIWPATAVFMGIWLTAAALFRSSHRSAEQAR